MGWFQVNLFGTVWCQVYLYKICQFQVYLVMMGWVQE
jgi:hypothetical protein